MNFLRLLSKIFCCETLDSSVHAYQSQYYFKGFQKTERLRTLTEEALICEDHSYLAEYSLFSDIYARVRLVFNNFDADLVIGNFHFTETKRGVNGEVVKSVKNEDWDSILVKYQFYKHSYLNHPDLKTKIQSNGDHPTTYYIDVWIPIRFISYH